MPYLGWLLRHRPVHRLPHGQWVECRIGRLPDGAVLRHLRPWLIPMTEWSQPVLFLQRTHALYVLGAIYQGTTVYKDRGGARRWQGMHPWRKTAVPAEADDGIVTGILTTRARAHGGE